MPVKDECCVFDEYSVRVGRQLGQTHKLIARARECLLVRMMLKRRLACIDRAALEMGELALGDAGADCTSESAGHQ
jgi:hypothetical protein